MLRVGVAGLGKMGKLHFQNALHDKKAQVVAVADAQRSSQKSVEKYGIKIYSDYNAMIDSEDLDAVIISLPNFLKKDSIICAAKKNLAIFVDKPIARTFSEAEEIMRVAIENKATLMVGVNYRYFGSVQEVKRIVDKGEIGDIVIATSDLIMDGPFSHSLVPRPVPEWWLDKEKAGGGALLDLGYHLLDIFGWIFGKMELEFATLGHRYGLPVEDGATVVMRSTETDTRCIINVGWFSRTIFPNFNFRVNLHGTVGHVSTDHFAPRNLYLHAAKESVRNLCKKVVGMEVDRLSYTYYYASFAEILSQFFEVAGDRAESPVSLEGQLAIIKIIEDVYKKRGS